MLTHSGQSTRGACTLGEPMEHRTTFVATQGELLAGDAQSKVWQQCGKGTSIHMPAEIAPDATMSGILGWASERRVPSQSRS